MASDLKKSGDQKQGNVIKVEGSGFLFSSRKGLLSFGIIERYMDTFNPSISLIYCSREHLPILTPANDEACLTPG
jgi:hypothetical protein